MDRWNIAILVIAAYVAITSLVRLMVRRRDQLLGDFREQMEAEKGRKAEKKSRQHGGPKKAA
ncbi:MAG: hypothetical protein HUU20_04505 [Pirellulales bacterium]|nr:hypothetical protein [Pirellulales bacterium]